MVLWAPRRTVTKIGSHTVVLPTLSRTVNCSWDGCDWTTFVAVTTTGVVAPFAKVGIDTVVFTAFVAATEARPLPTSCAVTLISFGGPTTVPASAQLGGTDSFAVPNASGTVSGGAESNNCRT